MSLYNTLKGCYKRAYEQIRKYITYVSGINIVEKYLICKIERQELSYLQEENGLLQDEYIFNQTEWIDEYRLKSKRSGRIIVLLNIVIQIICLSVILGGGFQIIGLKLSEAHQFGGALGIAIVNTLGSHYIVRKTRNKKGNRSRTRVGIFLVIGYLVAGTGVAATGELLAPRFQFGDRALGLAVCLILTIAIRLSYIMQLEKGIEHHSKGRKEEKVFERKLKKAEQNEAIESNEEEDTDLS